MTDGNITAARTKLHNAIHRITTPQTLVHYNLVLTAPSLYQQLTKATPAQQGDNRTPAKSIPPLWLDPTLLLMEIDATVKTWARTPGDTQQRLGALANGSWRPQDTDKVTVMAHTVNSWCDQIIALLNPEGRKYIEGAQCPRCGKTTVYGRDSAGDIVRQPALRLITHQGCTCQACKAHWPPEKYLFLSRLLGRELPEGVVG